MEKQKKNSKITSIKFKNKIKDKRFLRFRKLFKKKTIIINKTFSFLKNPKRRMSIYLKQNNIFCSLVNNKNNETLVTTSTGIEKHKITKKSIKFMLPIILYQFFKKINKYNFIKNSIIINITCPKIYKKNFLKNLNKYCKKINIFINFYNKKCFNGCQVKKQKRKKQKGWKILK